MLMQVTVHFIRDLALQNNSKKGILLLEYDEDRLVIKGADEPVEFPIHRDRLLLELYTYFICQAFIFGFINLWMGVITLIASFIIIATSHKLASTREKGGTVNIWLDGSNGMLTMVKYGRGKGKDGMKDVIPLEHVEKIYLDAVKFELNYSKHLYQAHEWTLHVKTRGNDEPYRVFTKILPVIYYPKFQFEERLAQVFLKSYEKSVNEKRGRLMNEANDRVNNFNTEVELFIAKVMGALTMHSPSAAYSHNTDIGDMIHSDEKRYAWDLLAKRIRASFWGVVVGAILVVFNLLAFSGPYLGPFMGDEPGKYNYVEIYTWWSIIMTPIYLVIVFLTARNTYNQYFGALPEGTGEIQGIQETKKLDIYDVRDIRFFFQPPHHLEISQTLYQERGLKKPTCIKFGTVLWYSIIAFIIFGGVFVGARDGDWSILVFFIVVGFMMFYWSYLLFVQKYTDDTLHVVNLNGGASIIEDLRMKDDKVLFNETFRFNEVLGVLMLHKYVTLRLGEEPKHIFTWRVFLSTTRYDLPYLLFGKEITTHDHDIEVADRMRERMIGILNTMKQIMGPATTFEYKEDTIRHLPVVKPTHVKFWIYKVANGPGKKYYVALSMLFLGSFAAFLCAGYILATLMTGSTALLVPMSIAFAAGVIIIVAFTPPYKRGRKKVNF